MSNPILRTLADAPLNLAHRIESLGMAIQAIGYYSAAGIRRGMDACVLARYPEGSPRYVEVELASGLVVSLPMKLAADVFVSEMAV